MSILFVTDDLMFPSRVRGVAQSLGLEMKTAGPATLASISGEFALILIDLAALADVPATLQQLRSRWPAARTVGFGPHVDVALLEGAKAAGCELVLPRSQFSQRMPEIVALAAPVT